MDDNARTIGERIARARRREGLTQRDLAQRVQRSLAWAILGEVRAAATTAAPVVIAAADWDVIGARLHLGDLDEALGYALDSVDRLSPHVRSEHGTVLLGALNLRAAIAAARNWDGATAEDHLGRARELARGLDDNA